MMGGGGVKHPSTNFVSRGARGGPIWGKYGNLGESGGCRQYTPLCGDSGVCYWGEPPRCGNAGVT